MDFWDGFFDMLGDLFGEIGLLWVSVGTIVFLFLCYGCWWEFIR
jgi:hypothetical protein